MKSRPRYTVVTGEFHVFYPDLPRSGPQPDGDTVTFKPDDPIVVEGLKRFSRRAPKFNGRGTIPVRFEGIDALETHFQQMHQDMRWAKAARTHLLQQLGFGHVQFWDDLPHNVREVENNPTRGYLFANGIESNGRLLGLVCTGEAPAANGTPFRVNAEHLHTCVNLSQVHEGLAYAELYDTMPLALQRVFRREIEAAREACRGMWPSEDVGKDKSARIALLTGLQKLVMWPKLFRRLAAYFAAGYAGLDAFDDWVRDDRVDRDDAVRLPDGELGNIHDIYDIEGDRLSLRYDPWLLTIAPDPA
jgi:endonuclease YncB( thermonuclease family)